MSVGGGGGETGPMPDEPDPADQAPPNGLAGTPAAEVEIDEALVRALLAAQHPDLAELPLRELANGWDNTMYRLGDELTVRLPRRRQAAELVEHEQRWLPVLAPDLPVPVPAPVRIGRPTPEYPWSWSVLPWFAGRPAATDPALDGPAMARDLGAFLRALHRPSVPEAPINAVRGGPLAGREANVRERLDRLSGHVDADALWQRWEHCRDAPAWAGPPLWLHGDLHGHNLLTSGGRLVAVIDFGDLTAGDPATDLGLAWSVLAPADRETFRRAADSEARPIDEAMWQRAEGWALSVGIAIVANSGDNPAMHAMGLRLAGLGMAGFSPSG